ncbi:uncharacterized protein LOC120088185 [Benincasa hispida]|uniref:uncharacterized protein LOC120088185 n=1 Tax=Benincasa hispida TaxID=102211 RepID=UPI00190298DD|nr:uncharacterized protein LOC120088185 [Benincasa hispida]
MCDASGYAVGAVLSQRKDKVSHPIYYTSNMLNDAQENYTTTKKEMLVLVFALEKFRQYLIGTNVVVYTDYSAINENGITRHRTVRYTPQQNGLAERLNRTIMKRVRCLLSDAILSENFWAEAIAYTIYTLNKCPYTSLELFTSEEK